MGEKSDFLADGREIVERAHRHIDFIADTLAVNQKLRRIFLQLSTVYATDHVVLIQTLEVDCMLPDKSAPSDTESILIAQYGGFFQCADGIESVCVADGDTKCIGSVTARNTG